MKVDYTFTLRELRILTDYYEKSRYPDAIRGLPSEKITIEDANEAIIIAEKILNWCEYLVNKFKERIEDPDKEAIEVAKKIVKTLEERGLAIEQAYVFGSRVRGDWHNLSDLDIIIVSNVFKNLNYTKRLKLVLEKIDDLDVKYTLNFFIYTPSEFNEAIKGGNIAILDASRYWVKIK